MLITGWELLKSTYLLRDRWITLRADVCRTHDGHMIEPYYVIESKPWVNVVAFDSQNRILLNRQYRHGAEIIAVEIPCGEVEQSDVSPEAAVRRELLEETGYTAEAVFEAGMLYPNPARQSNRVHTFVATGVTKTQTAVDEVTERIDSFFSPVDEVLALVEQNAFPQALHVAALFLALKARGMLSVSGNAPK